MPRPERPVDPESGPVQAFAADLRQLRTKAGTPKYLQMSRASGRSRTALAEAACGDHLPTWETVEAFVQACDGDVREWRLRWEATRDQVRPAEPVTEPAPAPAPAPAPQTPSEEDNPVAVAAATGFNLRSGKLLTVAVGVLAVVAVLGFVSYRPTSSRTQTEHPTVDESGGPPLSATIVVQNKVAVGASGIAEDSTPAYLSSKPVSFCARRGCKVPGTEVWSGTILVARCWTRGATLTNRDLTSTGIENNPAGVSSDLWYEVVLHDDRAGYLSEVYVEARHRGGLRLLECPAPTALR
ncbi:hypothetical protein [Micromonospora sp. CA-111912]|uniref:hypothetical protein n=1 Tax=Micromonospora sp. CA-111912 TaxID=3239955 RepID=UPI003D8C2895